MSDDFEIDVEATKRVVQRGIISAVLAFLAVGGSIILNRYMAIFFQLVIVIVSISAMRTLSHKEAAVAGGVRWAGFALALMACIGAVILLLGHAFVLSGALR